MDSRPPVIGLVGAIGAGKSTVAAILRELGCVVSDSDALARAAFEDPAVVAAVQERWGGRVFRPDGAIDRSAVASIVFSDPAERAALEGLVHPWIEARRRAHFEAAPAEAVALVIDAPLLLEAGLDRACDAILFVDAPRDLRLDRLRETRGWDDAELARREAAQWPLERKRGAATHLLGNGGDRDALRRAVTSVLEEIVRTRPT